MKLFGIILLFINFVGLSLEAKEAQQAVVAAERYSDYQSIISNKRLGLVVNQTSQVKGTHLVDYLMRKQHKLEVIFAPEHGFRGNKGAGEKVASNRDVKTGLPIVSLYGKHKKPTKQHLANVDLLVFDIQDVGVRYYTYISTMHYVMQACADNNIPLLVLDRPNPNGDYIDGPVLKLEHQSFVGMHPIPIVHGLTVAELARMINGQGWLDDGQQCELQIVKVKNYDHSQLYSLPVKPSPNLPNDLSIRLYPSLGFFEATNVSVGRGTDFPFQVLGYPDKNMGAFEFRARSITGSWSKRNHAGAKLYGEKLNQALEQGVSLNYFLDWRKKFLKQNKAFITRPEFLTKLVGQVSFAKQVAAGLGPKAIKRSWKDELIAYQKKRQQYLLYPDHPQILRHIE